MNNRIYITRSDRERIRRILESRLPASDEERVNFQNLDEELERAEVVDRPPPGVITMHSEVRLQDLDTNEVKLYKLVFPGERCPGIDCVSVLAPIGTALLGYRTGSTIDWPVPRGMRRLRILSITQPQLAAAG